MAQQRNFKSAIGVLLVLALAASCGSGESGRAVSAEPEAGAAAAVTAAPQGTQPEPQGTQLEPLPERAPNGALIKPQLRCAKGSFDQRVAAARESVVGANAKGEESIMFSPLDNPPGLLVVCTAEEAVDVAQRSSTGMVKGQAAVDSKGEAVFRVVSTSLGFAETGGLDGEEQRPQAGTEPSYPEQAADLAERDPTLTMPGAERAAWVVEVDGEWTAVRWPAGDAPPAYARYYVTIDAGTGLVVSRMASHLLTDEFLRLEPVEVVAKVAPNSAFGGWQEG